MHNIGPFDTAQMADLTAVGNDFIAVASAQQAVVDGVDPNAPVNLATALQSLSDDWQQFLSDLTSNAVGPEPHK